MPFKPGQSGNPAGRPAKKDKFERPISAAETKIAAHLAELITLKIELARAGDGKAMEYLIDRIMGKPTERREQNIRAEVDTYMIDIGGEDERSAQTDE